MIINEEMVFGTKKEFILIKCDSCDKRLKEKIINGQGTEQDIYLCKKCFSFDEEKWWKKIFKHKFRYVCN